MDIVFTGFEPFGGFDYNPSWDVAQAAAQALYAQGHLLPVTFEAARTAANLVHANVLLVSIGVAASRSSVEFERFAHNATGDYESGSDGLFTLAPTGPAAFCTGVAVSELVRRWAAGVPARESRDAGVYVCNATYFYALRASEAHEGADALFVHVPMLDATEARRVGAELARCLAFL